MGAGSAFRHCASRRTTSLRFRSTKRTHSSLALNTARYTSSLSPTGLQHTSLVLQHPQGLPPRRCPHKLIRFAMLCTSIAEGTTCKHLSGHETGLHASSLCRNHYFMQSDLL